MPVRAKMGPLFASVHTQAHNSRTRRLRLYLVTVWAFCGCEAMRVGCSVTICMCGWSVTAAIDVVCDGMIVICTKSLRDNGDLINPLWKLPHPFSRYIYTSDPHSRFGAPFAAGWMENQTVCFFFYVACLELRWG